MRQKLTARFYFPDCYAPFDAEFIKHDNGTIRVAFPPDYDHEPYYVYEGDFSLNFKGVNNPHHFVVMGDWEYLLYNKTERVMVEVLEDWEPS